MTLAMSIAGAVTVAVTARLLYLFFLGGKAIRSATLTGRFLGRFKAAVGKFAAGWTSQSWRYRLIAFPCMLLTVAGVSALMYWLMPVMQNTASLWDIVKYCFLIFLVGVSSCLFATFLLVFGVYFIVELVGTWWGKESMGKNN